MPKFDFDKELAKVKANPPARIGKDELTEQMHETFTETDEDAKRAAVFAYLEMVTSEPTRAGEEEMEVYGVTTEDIRKYRQEFLSE